MGGLALLVLDLVGHRLTLLGIDLDAVAVLHQDVLPVGEELLHQGITSLLRLQSDLRCDAEVLVVVRLRDGLQMIRVGRFAVNVCAQELLPLRPAEAPGEDVRAGRVPDQSAADQELAVSRIREQRAAKPSVVLLHELPVGEHHRERHACLEQGVEESLPAYLLRNVVPRDEREQVLGVLVSEAGQTGVKVRRVDPREERCDLPPQLARGYCEIASLVLYESVREEAVLFEGERVVDLKSVVQRTDGRLRRSLPDERDGFLYRPGVREILWAVELEPLARCRVLHESMVYAPAAASAVVEITVLRRYAPQLVEPQPHRMPECSRGRIGRGGVLMVLSSGGGQLFSMPGLIEGSGAEHGVDDVAAAAGEANDRGVVFLPLGVLALVVGGRFGVAVRGDPCGSEQRVLELLVPGAGRVLAADRFARASGDGGDPGVGGEVPGGRKAGRVADDQEDGGCCLGPDSWHRDQDVAKREVIEQPLDLDGEFRPLRFERPDLRGDAWDHGLDCGCSDHGDSLLPERGEDVVDEQVNTAVLGLVRPGFHSRGSCFRERRRAPVAGQQVQGELVSQSSSREHAFQGRVDLQQQRPERVDRTRRFPGEVVVVAGEDLQRG